MDIYRGNFDIEDYVIERYPLKNAKLMVIKYYYQLIMM